VVLGHSATAEESPLRRHNVFPRTPSGATLLVMNTAGRPAPELYPGSIHLVWDDEGAVLCMHGDVDGPVVERFEADVAQEPLPVVAIDVGQMTYIDSTGLGFMVRWAQESARAGNTPALRNAHRRIDQVLAITGLDALFTRRD
jgi:anti-anti-sigma factor